MFTCTKLSNHKVRNEGVHANSFVLFVQRFRRSQLTTFNFKMKPEITWRKRLGKTHSVEPSTYYSSEKFKKRIRVHSYLCILITIFIAMWTNFYLKKKLSGLHVSELAPLQITWLNMNVVFVLLVVFDNRTREKCFL